ncbi:hypothetical protein CJ179_49895 [Rhodococcus sp. ACS1]|uniref:linalool dehydratase/isomerase domain-containing protein n=1 Tax=Rhodococcus sp. ACS1 TaxID=2028570 RepID=UPI000BB14A52|nr:hypothetical protein [Rhodococcus sp. ACS1]PBC35073.1 hypothetical protein CJ179_49895 [Rhodococcus sp. ACS1]
MTTAIGAGSQVPETALSELTPEQVGHLRHFANLLNQPANDWSLMQGKAFGQDDFGAYRFQLAFMAYGMALTHAHRLPAAPGVFKPLFDRAIEKMLLPEVWIYWKDTSRGGAAFNEHLTDSYHEEYNPVARDNIMYSAYVQSMALLFNYLFDDDKYAQPGALTFSFFTPFWGGEEKRYEYDQNTLNEHIYWLMVENGYLGVPCEPNCIYQICNQPAILGFRMHDILTGEAVADEVTEGYEKAWAQFGRLDENGHYNMMMAQDSKAVAPNSGNWPWVDAWCGSLMNMWNRDFVQGNYPDQITALVEKGKDGAISVVPGEPFVLAGNTVVLDSCDHGWVSVWASEMGDEETLQGLMTHADRYMHPKWRDGGLYYPRNDELTDAEGNRTEMEPITGNVLLAYARLNVKDGFWKLYNEPWDRSHYSEPALTTVAADIDVTRAYFDRDNRELVFTLHRRDDQNGDGVVELSNIDIAGQTWTLREDDRTVARGRRGAAVETEGVEMTRRGDTYILGCPDGGPHRYTLALEGAPTERIES